QSDDYGERRKKRKKTASSFSFRVTTSIAIGTRKDARKSSLRARETRDDTQTSARGDKDIHLT
ncbi:hypothetical protein X777_00324, partial [Ooceraea biroi]